MAENNKKIFDIAIIGAGGAGQMAILRAVLNHLHTIAFLGDANTARRGRATWVTRVENIPGMFDKKRPILTTTQEVLQFIERNETLRPFLTTLRKAAISIRKENDRFFIKDDEHEIQARFVLLCTGTMDIQPEIQGSIQPILPFANRGDVFYCIRCDGHRTYGHRCAVIGHKETAGWIAVMLKERYELPYIAVLSHGRPFEGTPELCELLDKYQIPIIPEKIEAILGDPKNGLEGFKTETQVVKVTKAFVALGSIVYNDLAKQLGVKLSEREHLLTNAYGETSVKGFYAAGDLVEGKKKQLYTAWDMAVDAVDDIDEKIRILKRTGAYTLDA